MRRSDEVVKKLRSMANPENVEGMARFGINPENTLGISIPSLRKIAKETGRDHQLAEDLWKTGIHEARILAALVGDPRRVTKTQAENWVKDFDSWDVCDQVCMNLLDKTPFAYEKALAWTGRRAEFVKRAGFALMAALAFHDKEAEDSQFLQFMPAIVRESNDGRNYVKKAISWALRQIGKRNIRLYWKAIGTAREIEELDSKAARWIARDVLRELTSEKVLERIPE
ncbi:MAG: DNA alkylation repair protein [Candidatus Latescibacteria bacterium]|nr:DNA alkylation repair protein [Candidatus Latescibacterota bacterium]